MGPWLYTCAQCGAQNHFEVSAMLLPEIHCRACGFVKTNPPEVRERVGKALEEHKWYAGFLELILAVEEELGISFEDADFPQPFVTWRRLLEVTLQHAGTAVTQEQAMGILAHCAGITEMDIRQRLDEPVHL
ncbi:hypothetical protein HF324_04875 [Chitinophaga oryzae]|uniref:Uncharacterized protein n=1 Tax=Chitinophaga oryzae TaxID=2725414 RepID=A0ABX6LE92_9BACT|nr:hypothetical protein [Chitinophaga oryzae]QJB37220.1 hypothetical protein HF324_04875 [Chitinophaga oryzae]